MLLVKIDLFCNSSTKIGLNIKRISKNLFLKLHAYIVEFLRRNSFLRYGYSYITSAP